MTHSDPSDELRRLRLPHLSSGIWTLLVFLASASPWVLLAVMVFGGTLQP